MNKKTKREEKESLEIIGFKIFQTSKKIDFYAIIIYGVNDRPIMEDNSILFFAKLKKISEIVENGLFETKGLVLSSNKVSLVCDLKEALRLIENEEIDDSAIIINSLNMIFDFVKSTRISFPCQYKEILFSFADHLTFERNISTFFEKTNFSRTLVLDGLLWCVGAILSKSTIISE